MSAALGHQTCTLTQRPVLLESRRYVGAQYGMTHEQLDRLVADGKISPSVVDCAGSVENSGDTHAGEKGIFSNNLHVG